MHRVARLDPTPRSPGISRGQRWLGAAAALALAAFWLGACSSSSPSDPDPDPEPVASVVVTPSSAQLEEGSTRTYSAEARSAGGATLSGRTVVWSTLDASIATVNSSSGVVTGVAVGSTDVIATVEGITGSAVVEVVAIPVATVVITPDSASLGVSDTLTFQAETLDSGGALLAGRALRWSTVDEGVATIDSLFGLATAVGVGTTSVIARSESVADTAALSVVVFTRVWSTSAADTDWTNPDNWIPVGVPIASDVVLVRAGPNQPVLPTDVELAGLAVEDGAALTLAGFTLDVTGNLAAGSGISGSGTVLLSGFGTVSGSVPTLAVTGLYSLSGETGASGAVTVSGTGQLTIGAQTLNVAGSLATSQSGLIMMTAAAGVLDVEGNATFAGGSTDGFLSAGTLRVAGNFTQSLSGNFATFAATDAHLVVFDGAGAQTVSFASPSIVGNNSHLANLEIAGGDVTMPTRIIVLGDASVTSASAVTGTGTFQTLGDLSTVAGSSLATTEVELGGAMSIAGTLTAPTTEFQGTAQSIQPGLGYQAILVTGTASLTGPTSAGSVTVSGSGQLTIGAQTLNVAGNVATSQSGLIIMTDAAGVLDVEGNATFAGGDTDGLLTAGTVRVAGNFTQSAGTNFATFAATDAHLVVLDGAGAQTVTFANSVGSNSHFADLEIAGGDVTMPNRVTVLGDASVTSASAVTGTGTFQTLGDLSTVAGSSLATTEVELGGAMSIAGTLTAPTTEFQGTAQSIQPGLGYQAILVTGTASLTGTTSPSGSVTVSGSGQLTIGAQTLNVAGNLATSQSGLIIMTDVAGVLDVEGSATFAGTNTDGFLTAGTLRVAGNFTQSASGNLATFAATDAHLVVLDGADAQTVSFATASSINDNSHFAELQITGDAVTMSTNIVTLGDATLTGSMTLQATFTWQIDLDLVLEAGSALENNGTITVGGSCTDNGTTLTGTGGGAPCVTP